MAKYPPPSFRREPFGILKDEPRNPFYKQTVTVLATAWAFGLFLAACSPIVFAAEITYFYDGDTVKINDAGYEYKLRITDIDAPERNQTYEIGRAHV